MISPSHLPFPVATDRGYVGACQRSISEESLRASVESCTAATYRASSSASLVLSKIQQSTAKARLKNAELLRPINQGIDLIFGNVATNEKTFYIQPHHIPNANQQRLFEDGLYLLQTSPRPYQTVVTYTQSPNEAEVRVKSEVKDDVLLLLRVMMVAYLGIVAVRELLISGNPDNPDLETFRPASFKLIQASSFIGYCLKSALLLPGCVLGVAIGLGQGISPSRSAQLPNRGSKNSSPVEARLKTVRPPMDAPPPYSLYPESFCRSTSDLREPVAQALPFLSVT